MKSLKVRPFGGTTIALKQMQIKCFQEIVKEPLAALLSYFLFLWGINFFNFSYSRSIYMNTFIILYCLPIFIESDTDVEE